MLFDQKQFMSRLTKVFDKNGLSSMLNMERAEKLMRLTEIMLQENEKYSEKFKILELLSLATK